MEDALYYRSRDKRERNEDAMREAIALLKSKGVHFTQLDRYTLQFLGHRYWPRKRKLYQENEDHSLRNQGLEQIAELIHSFKRPSKSRTNETAAESATIVHLSDAHRK
jgi:hypothetical protein